jgi:uncharacterized membrane protein YozB (DUF420 family)
MLKQVFKSIKIIEFWIGVNIIGLPEIHQHKRVIYTNHITY